MTKPDMVHHILHADDARMLAMLHVRAFETPWSPAAIRSELAKSSTLGIGLSRADAPNDMVCFGLFQNVEGEAEILTLATDPPFQKQGFACALLTAARTHLQNRGVTRLILDVAADNRAAIRLYQGFGFGEDGRRRNYYRRGTQPNVDAVLMSLDLTGLPR